MTCQKCFSKAIGHHILPYTQNPALGCDKDNLITMCEECHKEIHKEKGMNYYELRCNK